MNSPIKFLPLPSLSTTFSVPSCRDRVIGPSPVSSLSGVRISPGIRTLPSVSIKDPGRNHTERVERGCGAIIMSIENLRQISGAGIRGSYHIDRESSTNFWPSLGEGRRAIYHTLRQSMTTHLGHRSASVVSDSFTGAIVGGGFLPDPKPAVAQLGVAGFDIEPTGIELPSHQYNVDVYAKFLSHRTRVKINHINLSLSSFSTPEIPRAISVFPHGKSHEQLSVSNGSWLWVPRALMELDG